MKTSAKHFSLAVALKPSNMSQNDPKTTSLMTSVTKKRTPNQKFFFECNLPDWPIPLSPWTAL